jgi:hypothetical protein
MKMLFLHRYIYTKEQQCPAMNRVGTTDKLDIERHIIAGSKERMNDRTSCHLCLLDIAVRVLTCKRTMT